MNFILGIRCRGGRSCLLVSQFSSSSVDSTVSGTRPRRYTTRRRRTRPERWLWPAPHTVTSQRLAMNQQCQGQWMRLWHRMLGRDLTSKCNTWLAAGTTSISHWLLSWSTLSSWHSPSSKSTVFTFVSSFQRSQRSVSKFEAPDLTREGQHSRDPGAIYSEPIYLRATP